MTLQTIIDQARYRLNNFEKPYRWLDAELVFYANEAENVIARDTQCLVDTETESVCRLFTVAGTIDYAISPLILSVLSVRLVQTELMTLDTTPAPTAFAAAATVTGVTSTKSCTVVEKLTATTYTVEHRDGLFTAGEVVGDGTNSIDLAAGYPTFAENSDDTTFLAKTNVMEINTYGAWRNADQDEPSRWMLDYQTGHTTIYPPPDDHYALYLSVIRYPLTALTTSSMSAQTPEIDAAYHQALIDGICYQAYLKAGDDTFDADRSKLFYGLFRAAISRKKIQNNLFVGGGQVSGPHGGFI
jgi:hypothetical protein